MDPITLGAAVAGVLGSVLGSAGARLADSAGEALADGVLDAARGLLRRLAPSLRGTPAAGAIADLTADPADEAARTTLGREIGLLLRADRELRRQANDLVRTYHASVRVRGNGNLVQHGGGNIAVSGSTGVTIDNRQKSS